MYVLLFCLSFLGVLLKSGIGATPTAHFCWLPKVSFSLSSTSGVCGYYFHYPRLLPLLSTGQTKRKTLLNYLRKTEYRSLSVKWLYRR